MSGIVSFSNLALEGEDGCALIVHGGAYKVPDHLLSDAREGAKRAALVGYKVLHTGGTALDAVEAAVRSLEDRPCFNAGTGACLTSEKTVELDAFIMDGKTRSTGAVAAVHGLKHPVSAARLVMEKTEHCLLVGDSAVKLAKTNGMQEVEDEELITEESRRRFKEFRQFSKAVSLGHGLRTEEHDTVGAAAVDNRGHVAAATSTGGITGKLPGRVGDSPVPGSGGWADNKLGAVSTTGHGEAIMRSCLGFGWAVGQKGDGPDEYRAESAASEVLQEMATRIHGAAGLVAVTPRGSVVRAFNTERMTWAYVREKDSAGRQVHCGVLPGDDYVEPVHFS